jgi:hypothetical protein
MPFSLNTFWGRTTAPSPSFSPELEEELIDKVDAPYFSTEDLEEVQHEEEITREEDFSEEFVEEVSMTEELFSAIPAGNQQEENRRVVPPASIPNGKFLDAPQLQALFATETYKGMKGILGELADSLALNQRFMFTKELFDGNADLLRFALKSVDQSSTFAEAVDLINARYVIELGWDIESEEVREFMQQVYRKFVS